MFGHSVPDALDNGQISQPSPSQHFPAPSFLHHHYFHHSLSHLQQLQEQWQQQQLQLHKQKQIEQTNDEQLLIKSENFVANIDSKRRPSDLDLCNEAISSNSKAGIIPSITATSNHIPQNSVVPRTEISPQNYSRENSSPSANNIYSIHFCPDI